MTIMPRKPLDLVGSERRVRTSVGSGLVLYVSPRGDKSWRLQYTYQGKRSTLAIGPYPEMTLEEAEARLAAIREAVGGAHDTTVPSKVVEGDNSFEKIAREWFEKFSGKWNIKYRDAVLLRLEKSLFPLIGKEPIDGISPKMLFDALQQIAQAKTLRIAHMTRNDCLRIFRYAIATDRADRNIGIEVKGLLPPMPAVKKLGAITEEDAIGRLMAKIAVVTGTVGLRYALRLAPLVFVLPLELVTAKWSQINMQDSLWHIPTGFGRSSPKLVPLSKQAMALLRSLKKQLPLDRSYLFPGILHKNDVGEKHLRPTTLSEVLRRLGYAKEEMSIMGFRSMASVALGKQGFNRAWIDLQLGKKVRLGNHEELAHDAFLEERRQMMQAYADYLDGLRERHLLKTTPEPQKQYLLQCLAEKRQ